MNEKGKLNFLEKVFLAITDFRVYPFLLKNEKLGKAILYMLTLIFIFSAIITGNFVSKVSSLFTVFFENYDVIMPEFELEKSNLVVDEKLSYDFDKKDFCIVVDTDYLYENYKTTNEYDDLLVYDYLLLINNNKAVLELDGEEMFEIDFSGFESSINKASLYDVLLKYNNDFGAKLQVVISVFITVVITYIITVTIRVIFIALIASFLSLLYGVKASAKNYIKLAIYAYTLPFIIEIISVCLVGSIKDYAYYTSMILTYVYVLYALRAVKLDAFITLFNGNKENKDDTASVEDVSSDIKNTTEDTSDENEKKINESEEKHDNNE